MKNIVNILGRGSFSILLEQLLLPDFNVKVYDIVSKKANLLVISLLLKFS